MSDDLAKRPAYAPFKCGLKAIRQAACTVVSLLAPLSAAIATENQIFGAGSASCSEFIASYKKLPTVAELQFFGWASGWESGVNAALIMEHKQPLDLKPPGFAYQEQFAYIRRYCETHPLDQFVYAVMNLMTEIGLHQESRP